MAGGGSNQQQQHDPLSPCTEGGNGVWECGGYRDADRGSSGPRGGTRRGDRVVGGHVPSP